MDTDETSGTLYRIEIEGGLKAGWMVWLNGMATNIQPHPSNPGHTTITARVPDQAALRGLLNKIWDLNLTVISVMIVKESDPRC
jgi:hypothetical protein